MILKISLIVIFFQIHQSLSFTFKQSLSINPDQVYSSYSNSSSLTLWTMGPSMKPNPCNFNFDLNLCFEISLPTTHIFFYITSVQQKHSPVSGTTTYLLSGLRAQVCHRYSDSTSNCFPYYDLGIYSNFFLCFGSLPQAYYSASNFQNGSCEINKNTWNGVTYTPSLVQFYNNDRVAAMESYKGYIYVLAMISFTNQYHIRTYTQNPQGAPLLISQVSLTAPISVALRMRINKQYLIIGYYEKLMIFKLGLDKTPNYVDTVDVEVNQLFFEFKIQNSKLYISCSDGMKVLLLPSLDQDQFESFVDVTSPYSASFSLIPSVGLMFIVQSQESFINIYKSAQVMKLIQSIKLSNT